MMELQFFKPISRTAIWGGTLIKNYFGYKDFSDDIGQSWAFSAQESESNKVIKGEYKGMTLRELWKEHPELFCSRHEELPVIISLVAPEDDLSIQVHPNAEYAKKLGYKMGKNEAWYFIEAEEDATIVYGHNAKDERALRDHIKKDKWNALIRHLSVHTGDCIYIPAGKIHALRKGSVVYEVQQATDVTYRFHDYHRVDKYGNERELHLEQAIACISYNQESEAVSARPILLKSENAALTTYIENDSFCVKKLEVTGKHETEFYTYQLATVVAGNGFVNKQKVTLGDSFLIPCGIGPILFDGKMAIMMTSEEYKSRCFS